MLEFLKELKIQIAKKTGKSAGVPVKKVTEAIFVSSCFLQDVFN